MAASQAPPSRVPPTTSARKCMPRYTRAAATASGIRTARARVSPQTRAERAAVRWLACRGKPSSQTSRLVLQSASPLASPGLSPWRARCPRSCRFWPFPGGQPQQQAGQHGQRHRNRRQEQPAEPATERRRSTSRSGYRSTADEWPRASQCGMGAVASLGYGRPAYPWGGDAAFRAGPHPSCAASIAAERLPAEVDLLTRCAVRRRFRRAGAPSGSRGRRSSHGYRQDTGVRRQAI